MKNKWIKDKQESLKNQTSGNLSDLSIQPKESIRHIKNNIENNKNDTKANKIDSFSDFLVDIIRQVTMKYNLCCKLWSGFTPIEVKTNLNGNFITISDVLLKQILLGLTVDNQLVFRTIDKDTDFLLDSKLIGYINITKNFVKFVLVKVTMNLKKVCFLKIISFPELKKVGIS